MRPSIDNIVKKGRGRPKTGSKPVLVRLSPDQVRAIDDWMSTRPDVDGRPMAIRHLLDLAFERR